METSWFLLFNFSPSCVCVCMKEKKNAVFRSFFSHPPEAWKPERPRGGVLDVMRETGIGGWGEGVVSDLTLKSVP